MSPVEENRVCEIMVEGVGWKRLSSFSEVSKGDTFRIFEEDGTLIESNGKTEFVASKDAYQDGIYGIWCIETDDEDEENNGE